MPFYTWNADLLSVKVKNMDSEHQVLIDKMNKVYDCFKQQSPKNELDRAVNDFVEYTVTHFKHEEQHMENINFPGLATHKIIHAQLLGEVTKHIDEYKKKGTLSDSFFSFLSVWLTSHIRGIDNKYGEFKG